jgi:hypothetical protein
MKKNDLYVKEKWNTIKGTGLLEGKKRKKG